MASSALLRSLRRRDVSSSAAYRFLTGNANPARAPWSWGNLSRSSSSVGGELGASGPRVTDVEKSKALPTSEGMRTSTSMFSFSPLGAQLAGTPMKRQALTNPADMLLGTRRVMSTTSREALQGTRQVLRPLSPHLPVYRPQVSSTSSIFNRISGAFLTGVILAFYLLCMKIGPICYTFESFYQLLFYSSKLTLLSVELSALALAYHVYHSLPHIFR